jgi:hypothetical protein
LTEAEAAAGQHHPGSGPEQVIQLPFGLHVERGAIDHAYPVGPHPDAARDRGRDLRPERVEHGDQSDQAQVAFRVPSVAWDRCAGRPNASTRSLCRA